MPDSTPDERTLAAVLADQARAVLPEELTPEEALAYLEGNLAPEDEARVARLATASPAVSRMLVDLADLAAAPGGARAGPADLGTRAGWRDFSARLAAEAAPRRPPTWLSGLAAALALLGLGLGFRVWQLERARRSPVANLASLELVKDRAGERDLALAEGAPLRLVLSPAAECASYAAVLRGASGEETTLAGLERNERGLLTALVRLEAGEWELHLSCAGEPELEVHRFRILRPDAK